MKNIFTLVALLCSATLCSEVYAQQTPPPGGGDKNLRDNNVKARSTDLERVERDARKNNKSGSTPAETAAETDLLAVKYAEIKTDFEQIQISQDDVIKAYKSGRKVDYAQISKSALEINKSAIRLNSNLFPLVEKTDPKKEESKKDEKKDEKNEAKPTKSVRDLIVELDNTIGSFATSPMFQNLRVVDPQVSEKTKLELEKIIELSGLLDAEARKAATVEK